MGNWAIIIEGTGAHDNPNYPNDADKLAKKFVRQLCEAGHTLMHAAFVAGGTKDLMPQPESE